MIELLIGAAAMAEAPAGAAMIGPSNGDSQAEQLIVVEGHRSASSRWTLPKLEYDEPEICPALVETDLPGFGVLRLRKDCATDRTEEWRVFPY